ncbi:sugar MFS transporter [Petrotoga sp. 9PWA.NaAc.5.4]|uniref:MFS transporter n=1 Tax=Petrotoga sp. 9PWA.NaAc.5.4 TaxID=1434328 RepID=UPI000CA88568|nr:MFS transporter [Petrotoga sp. 9PWA.NaAc.5.4]PNR94821.1 MFS transporter [Petrotoga sp. 9PWA.NaAc.5.4]
MLALLVIIYISFISLGLPDSLLGSAWPVMYKDLSVSVSYAGILSMIVSLGTVVSSFLSARFIKRFGTGRVTLVSVSMTAIALIGFGLSHSFFLLLFLAIPLGLGAGSVDAALNNFVALHYEAKHMNWLHSFWGVGVTTGPVIMSFWLAKNNNWNMGYITIGIIQSVLVVVLIISLPLWNNSPIEKKRTQNHGNKGEDIKALSLSQILKIPKSKMALLAFFSYCSLELTTGLWASSYAVNNYGVLSEIAAFWTSVYYLGITIGRFFSGFMSIRFSNKQLIKIGLSIIFVGITLIILPLPVWKIPIGLSFIGLGCAPIYPSMLHQTPRIFGKELSQSMMGVQMAFAYSGSTFTPLLFGLIAEYINISLFPAFLLILAFILLFTTEIVNGKIIFDE